MKKTILRTTFKKRRSEPGKWVPQPTRSTIIICVCGNKYIATRKKQTQCITCTYTKTR